MFSIQQSDGALVAASIWAFLAVAWSIIVTVVALLIAFRAMRAHERLADAVDRIAQK